MTASAVLVVDIGSLLRRVGGGWGGQGLQTFAPSSPSLQLHCENSILG